MHYFDENIAKEYGVAEAVMFQNIAYWVKENEAHDINFHDGRYWTFNSRKAFSIFFKYWTENQVKRIIEKLYTNGLLLKGNYNKANYDKTNWYTLSDKGLDIANYKDEAWLKKSNDSAENTWSKKSEAWSEKSNDGYQINQPIPYIKHNNKTHIYEEEAESKKVDIISELVEVYNSLGAPFKKVTKITKGRRQKANERLKEMGGKEKFIQLIKKMDKCSFLKGNNQRGWLADFDFLIQNSEKWVKLYEGTYDDVEPKERKGKLEQYHNDPELDDFDVNEKIAEYNRTHTDQIKM